MLDDIQYSTAVISQEKAELSFATALSNTKASRHRSKQTRSCHDDVMLILIMKGGIKAAELEGEIFLKICFAFE